MRALVFPAIVLLFPLALLAAEVPSRPPVEPRRQLLDAMGAEVVRAMKGLRLGDHEPPFFVGLQVKEFDTREVNGKFGALYENQRRRYRSLLADVRVGSYEFDSTPEPDALGLDFDVDLGAWEPDKTLPVDDDPTALRTAIWLVVDDQYKRALSSYLKKRGKQVYRPEDADRPTGFSHEKPVSFVEPARPFAFDDAAWSAEVRRVTARFQNKPGLFDCDMRVTADKVVRLFTSSEGSSVVTEQLLYGLHVSAHARAPDGMLLENGRDFYGATEAELPRGERLDREVKTLIEELVALEQAPLVDPFTGPALLSPEATGVLFHEAIGHRLEGERQDDENEGRTFKGQVGNQVLPPFIGVLDDPTLAAFDLGARRVTLNGFYRYDEQGVPAQAVTLIDAGVLRTYLMSRHPVKGFALSNGHGRSAGNRMPVARMANLLVRPTSTVPDASMKKLLLDEVRRQKKPYGIYIKDMTGGNTNTGGDGYQAFKGMSRLVYRLRAEDGREELVRGVELVGTPLSSVNRIVAMGDKAGIFNGFCGAESGYVPVSTVAPAALVGEFELQRTRKNLGRPPLLAAPAAAR